jgi:putative hemolysin
MELEQLMLQPSLVETPVLAPLEVGFARSLDEVREVQRLRFEVFGRELGARVPGYERGLDCDPHDAHCAHLMVRDGGSRQVVGTYRLLDAAGARTAGGFYSAAEFDLARLAPILPRTVEIGRACVHPDYRRGGVISLLWVALLRHILARGYDYVIGCASIPAADGGHVAATVCRQLLQHHLGPACWRVVPRAAFVLEGWADVADAEIPSLVKGYLRLGAFVAGEPAWDGDFKTADLLMMLPIANLNRRYVDRLLRHA